MVLASSACCRMAEETWWVGDRDGPEHMPRPTLRTSRRPRESYKVLSRVTAGRKDGKEDLEEDKKGGTYTFFIPKQQVSY
jgi:hypothetical protein